MVRVMPAPGVIVDGKYRILRLIGSGGMGSVYEGVNVRIGRRVAIKILHEAIAKDRRAVDRFEREAQAAACIASHHVADVFDLGDLATGERYMVMEYLEGETLAARLDTVKIIPPAALVPLAIQLLDGLCVTHTAGIVHRDLKPANIFLARSESGEFLKILDFGVCKFRMSGLQWTTSGATLLGTPGYISPEQITGEDIDGRADLYAVGTLLYRCITGSLPFEAASHSELLRKIRDCAPTPIVERARDLDDVLAAIVTKSMARDRAERFQTAEELREALRGWGSTVARVDSLLAEFLDRPERVTPDPLSSQPPRFASMATPVTPLEPSLLDVATPVRSFVPQALEDNPATDGCKIDNGCIDGSGSTLVLPDVPVYDPVAPSASASVPRPKKPSPITAMALGGALGVVAALVVYGALLH
jgi:eukaryotic-like serine/threonine-protein kinase